MVTSADIEKIKIPSGYGEIVSKAYSNLSKTNIEIKLADYKKKKLELLDQGDIPKLIRKKSINQDAFRISNTIFLKQSESFERLANDEIIKPILYYYAEQALFAFFLYSFFSYESDSKHHGLSMHSMKNLSDISVEINQFGFFSRLLDMYSIYEVGTVFSPIIFQNSGFTKNDNEFSILNKSIFTLDELIKIQNHFETHNPGNHRDIVDFILLFIASSLARYKPLLWNQILEGNRTTYKTNFINCFNRFEIVKKRIILAIIQESRYHHNSFFLNAFDIEINQNSFNVYHSCKSYF